MYYKIENKESEVYKKLYELRKKEIQFEKDNVKAIEEKTGLTWESFLGYAGQQNFNRVTQFTGFNFKEIDKIDSKIWKNMLIMKIYMFQIEKPKQVEKWLNLFLMD